MRKLFRRIGKMIEYLLAILFVGIFTLYCSGRVGWFLLLVLLLTPGLSVIYAGVAARYLDVTGSINGEIYSKGDHLFITLTLINRGFFPSAFLRIELLENQHWESEEYILVTTLSPKSEEHIQISYQAKYAGGSEIGIKNIYVCDFLGFASIPLRLEEKILRWKVGIIPDIEQATKAEEFLRQVMQDLSGQNESEETIDVSTDTFGGVPGYEYREYRPGDPIKRIHYKLSATKDELWVRLDEKQAIATVHLMLDPYNTLETDIAIDVQHVLEVSLGLVQSLILHEIAVEVWIQSEGKEIERHGVNGEDQLLELARELAMYQFVHERRPMHLPVQVERAEAALIYVTPHSDRELLLEIEAAKEHKGVNLQIYCTAEGGDKAC